MCPALRLRLYPLQYEVDASGNIPRFREHWQFEVAGEEVGAESWGTRGTGPHVTFMLDAPAYTVADKTSMAYFVACAVKINPSLPAFNPTKPGDTSGPPAKPEPEHFVAFKRVPLSTVHGTT